MSTRVNLTIGWHHLTALKIIMLLTVFFISQNLQAEVQLGEKAPMFDLFDQYGNPHQLLDYRGRWLILYFYPKDDTPGCTTEACNFRDDIFTIHDLGAEVVGISVDNIESHASFAEKHGLPYPLLSDGDAAVADSYGSAWSLGPVKIAKRHSFIIDPEGNIAMIYREVDPTSHSQEIIKDLKRLQ